MHQTAGFASLRVARVSLRSGGSPGCAIGARSVGWARVAESTYLLAGLRFEDCRQGPPFAEEVRLFAGTSRFEAEGEGFEPSTRLYDV